MVGLKKAPIGDQKEPTDVKGREFVNRDLPPELWAMALEYLPFQDLLAVSAVSRVLLKDVLPKVTRVQLFRPKDLQARVARRFASVEKVYICCLLHKPILRVPGPPIFIHDEWNLEYCRETQYRIVPFLTQFPKLTYAFCGAVTVWEGRRRDVWDGVSRRADQHAYTTVRADDRQSHEHRALVHQCSGAMAVGAMASTCEKIDGLFHVRGVRLCPNTSRRIPQGAEVDENPFAPCQICDHIVDNIPSSWLLNARGKCICMPMKKRLEEIVRRGDQHLVTRPERIKEIFREALSKDSSTIKFEPQCLEELNKMKDLDLLKAKESDPVVFYKLLKKFKSDEALSFPRKTLDELIALGFQFTAQGLKDYGIPLKEESCDSGDDNSALRSFFEHFLNPLRDIGNVDIEIIQGVDHNPELELLRNLAVGGVRRAEHLVGVQVRRVHREPRPIRRPGRQDQPERERPQVGRPPEAILAERAVAAAVAASAAAAAAAEPRVRAAAAAVPAAPQPARPAAQPEAPPAAAMPVAAARAASQSGNSSSTASMSQAEDNVARKRKRD